MDIKKFDLSIIRDKAGQYKELLDKIENRRSMWKSHTKELIKDTLTEIKKSFNFDWDIQTNDFQKNHEAVLLHFRLSHSGIVEESHNGFRAFIKRGAYIAYSQTVDGRIAAWISYPYIEELQEPPPKEIIEILEPEEIEENKMVVHFQLFLDKIIQLEEPEKEQFQKVGFVYGLTGIKED